MIRWNNDYNHGAHPAILQAFVDTNDSSYEGYGLDEWCRKAAGEIRKHLGGVDADIHFDAGRNPGELHNDRRCAPPLPGDHLC